MTAEHEAADAGVLLAGVVYQRGFPINDLFADVTAALTRDGAVLAGVLQTSGVEPGCDVSNVRLGGLGGDWQLPVLENRGRAATGCRLDYAAIAEVTARIMAQLRPDADLVVLNRFGRAESEGGGFRPVLARCLELGLGVLIAVRADYAEDWASFHGGLGIDLPPDRDAILAWCRRRLAATPRRPAGDQPRRFLGTTS